MMKKSIHLGVFFFCALFSLNAQNEKQINQSYDLGLDFQTRYVWRGLLLGGSSPSLQPGMSYTIEGFTAGVWGAFSCNQLSVQELDIYLSYTFFKDMFTVSVTDYCFPDETDDNFNYFDYRNSTTSHVYEAGFSFNGVEKVPISAGVYFNFYGADAKRESGKNVFSTYAEIAYNPTITKLGVDLSIMVGAAINGQSYIIPDDFGIPTNILGFYGNEGFAIVNVGLTATKNIELTEKLSLPCMTGLYFNPNSKKAYFVLGVGLAL